MYDTDDELVELLLIPKVGRAKARALYSAGYRTVEDISRATPDDLSKVPGVSLEMAKNMIEFVKVMGLAKEEDKLETSKELLICPMCGSMVSGDSNVCAGCGITFSDDVEDLEVPPPVKDAKEDDGFWYKKQTSLFICPECGSMVSDGADKCPKCGVLFGDEEEELAPIPEPSKDGDKDGYWYKDVDSTLFMCPNCGSFIRQDADHCGACGIVFEDDGEEGPEAPEVLECPMCKAELKQGTDACESCGFDFTAERERGPDGYWYKEAKGLFMCPNCGSFLPGDATRCGACGTVLEEGEEEGPEPKPEFVICPTCNAAVPSDANACESCGFDFSTEKDKDGFWYKQSGSIFICPNCGAFLSEAADRCHNCGIVFEEAAVESDEALVSEVDELIEATEVEEELVAIAEAPAEQPEEVDVSRLYLCPICGAFVQANMLNCPSCNTVFDDIGDLDLEPVSPLTAPIESPEELAKEIAEDIKEIEEELLEAPKAAEDRRGVSKDFLERWKKLDSKEPAKKSITRDFKKRWESVKETDEDIEKELDIGSLEIPDEVLEAEIEQLEEEYDDVYWVGRAKELAASGDVEEAVACLDKAADLNPDKELEYKRLMLELMGVSQGEEKVDLSEIGAIDEIGELSIDRDLMDRNTFARLEEVEAQLELWPESSALWQEKGELLEMLGRHEEAVDCFDKSITLSYSELQKDAKDLIVKRGVPQIGIGLTNGQGRVNGRVNGLLIQRGLINGSGRINGMINGRGQVNGMINGRGRTNGLINGGLINGLARGRVNGRVNGLTEGLTDGRTNGLTNGRSPGLINGGLVNGLGLVNGEGMVNGSGSLRRLRHRQRERIMWRYRLSAMVLFVTVVLMMSMLSNLIVQEERGNIHIDGNFTDWNDVSSFWDSTTDQVFKPELNILESKMVYDSGTLNIYVRLEGAALMGQNLMGNASDGVDSVWALVDLDSDPGTGYDIYGMGADMTMEIYGWNRSAMGSNVYIFDEGFDRNDWSGFRRTSSATVSLGYSELEASMMVPRDVASRTTEPSLMVLAMDSLGNIDLTDCLMSTGTGNYGVVFTHAGQDVLAPASTTVLGTVGVKSHCSDEAELNWLNFTLTGTAGPGDFDLGLFNDLDGNGALDAQDAPIGITISASGGNISVVLDEPVPVALNRTTNLLVAAGMLPSATGGTMGLALTGANVSGCSGFVMNENSRIHHVGAPSGMAIDGAFGDWLLAGSNVDPADDVVSPEPGIINKNIDLADVRLLMDDDKGYDELHMYLAVSGTMMGGTGLPTLRQRPSSVQPTIERDSDRDGVPDLVDPMPFDFDNDGTNDTLEFGDYDSDGEAEYPRDGNDWYMNTTIPADFPANYSNKNVSVYVGPVSQTHAVNMGEDWAYIMVNNDNSTATGRNFHGNPGVDYVVAVSGKNNRLLSSELYVHDPANGPTYWTLVDNVSCALDWYRMEGVVGLGLMGITSGQNFSVSVYLEDWNGAFDSSELAIGSEHVPSMTSDSGTRAPKPNLRITKSVDLATAAPGDTLTYTIVLTNNVATGYNIAITEYYPAGVTFVSATPAPTSGDDYWYIGTMLPGTSVTITITVVIDSTGFVGGEVLTNEATYFVSDGGKWTQSRSDDVSTTIVVPIPEMRNLALPIFGILAITIITIKRRRNNGT